MLPIPSKALLLTRHRPSHYSRSQNGEPRMPSYTTPLPQTVLRGGVTCRQIRALLWEWTLMCEPITQWRRDEDKGVD